MEPDGRVKIRDDVFFLKFFKTFSYTQHFPAHEKRNYPIFLENKDLQKYQIRVTILHNFFCFHKILNYAGQ